jgi:Protein of unknown function (DUF3313)
MHKKTFVVIPALALLLAGIAVPASAASPAASWDGLVEVSSPKMDVAYLMPGADFRAYNKVMLDKPEVAFRKNWVRDMNRGVGHRVDDDDARKILSNVQSNTTDIFSAAFAKAGYAVVTEPGPDVLRVRSGIIDLYVNAPDTMSAARGRTYTANAGEATLVLELRDSMTNALLGRVLDRRETRGMPGVSNSATNVAEYRSLAQQWAGISVKGLDKLKAHSPIPDPLKPGQKLD